MTRLSLSRPLLAALCVFLCSDSVQAEDASDPKVTVRLVELIQKKQYDLFTKELSVKGMDVNQPTPKGAIPIIEAVKIKNVKFVDALIQYGAQLAVKEPGSEVSPILIAFQTNAVDIARMLLAYGADPKATAKNGKSAADVQSSPAIKELYDAWEKNGAMAFEEPPGTWFKATEKGSEYWFNKETKEGRWNLPPACAWQRSEVKSGPSLYVNYVTGQSTYKLPPALSWRKVRAHGADVWYNWQANITQHDQPDEMPQYLIEEASKTFNVRWYNEKTREYSWEDPKTKSHWKAINEDGKTYYFNLVTAESQWEIPDELAWTKHEHEGSHYWHNQNTGDNTWDLPAHESWIIHDHDL